jgi:hypothetical protein
MSRPGKMQISHRNDAEDHLLQKGKDSVGRQRLIERCSFEFNDRRATKLQIIKEQGEVKVLVANLKGYLATNGSEASHKFQHTKHWM